MNESNKFSVVDYVIFALMLTISASIGIFNGCFGKKNKTSKNFLVASGQMSVCEFNLWSLLQIMFLLINYVIN